MQEFRSRTRGENYCRAAKLFGATVRCLGFRNLAVLMDQGFLWGSLEVLFGDHWKYQDVGDLRISRDSRGFDNF